MSETHDPNGWRLPICLTSDSNGEYEPVPLGDHHHAINKRAFDNADANAKRLGLSRRAFMVSSAGAASSLLAFNEVNAAAGVKGGFFDLPAEAALDEAAAAEAVGGNEFIFDVHGHFVNPTGAWLEKLPEGAPKPFFADPRLSADNFIKDVFMDSDTDMMVLTFVPSNADAEPLTIEEATATQKIIDEMDGTARILVHGRVNPNQVGDVDRMDELASEHGVAAWKTYTQWSPEKESFDAEYEKTGFWMTDDIGLEMIEKARSLGIRNICIHKGIPFKRDESLKYAGCEDIGKVAKMYPDVNFLIYHSGWDPRVKETAYTEGKSGIDSLVESLIANDVAPNSNVYADLGTTWYGLMRDMEAAAHGMGKLLKYCGNDNVLWGTDSIWYGSPQNQIQAFRTFSISEEFREAYGYPEITAELRAKIFGHNGAKVYGLDATEIAMRTGSDRIAAQKMAYAEAPNPHFQTFGPKNRREFLNFRARGG